MRIKIKIFGSLYVCVGLECSGGKVEFRRAAAKACRNGSRD